MLVTNFTSQQLKEGFILLLICSIGLLCVYTPTYLPLRWGANHAPQIMIFYFFLGIVFFVLKKPNYTLTSFACCAALCLFLKESTHGQQVCYAVPTDQPELKIAHFNVANLSTDVDIALEKLIRTDADILSIQGLDPMWAMMLSEALNKDYPHQTILPSLSFDGIGVLSKHAFVVDTFYYEDTPNLFGELHVQGYGEVYFVSSHIVPALTYKDYYRNQAHLTRISKKCQHLEAPLITFGDYHLVPWSPEIRSFRAEADLNDSRIGFTPSFIDGRVDFLDIPQDHIFYSNHFKCTSFSVINSINSPHTGIIGTFELLKKGELLSDANLYHPDVVQ